MRPLKLTMKAFGPYAKEQTIDFTELGGRNLFLITGPTGAGKTTIFDGICFAIYGKASGRDRDSQSMRSHFADDGVITTVELEFELRGRRYRVRREPKQLKKKVRGEGFTDYGPEAEFQVLDDEDYVTLSGVREVDEKVIEILGINYEQFRQIIMVPQGEFRELLMTESKDREDILRKIFGTEAFLLIQEKLTDQAVSLKSAVNTLKTQLEQNISNIDCATHAELASVKATSPDNTLRVIAELTTAISADGSSENELQLKIDEHELLVFANQQNIFQAKENNRKIMNRDEAELTKTILEKQQSDIEQKKQRLQLARKALGVIGLEDHYRSWDNNIQKKTTVLKELGNREISMQQGLQDAEIRYNFEVQNEAARNALVGEQMKMKGLQDKIVDFEKRRTVVAMAEEKLSGVAKRLQAAKKQLENEKAAINNSQQALDIAKSAAVEYIRQTSQLDRIRSTHDKTEKLKAATDHLDLLRQNVSRSFASMERNRDVFASKQQEYDAAKTLFFQGQASVLAAQLQAGQPCPVCGSPDHPQIAGKLHGVLADSELKALDECRQAAQDAFEDSKYQSDRAHAEEYAQQQIVARFITELAELVNENIGQLEKEKLSPYIAVKMAELQQQTKAAEVLVDTLAKQKNQETALTHSLEQQKSFVAELEKTIEQLQIENTVLNAQVQGEKSVLQNLDAELPAHIRSHQALAAEVNNLNSQYQKMKKNLAEADTGYRNAQTAHSKVVAEKASAENVLAEAKRELNTAKMNFITALAAAGFAGETDYATAKIAESDMNALDKEIADFSESLRSARDNYEKLQQEVAGLSLLHTDSLEAELRGIQDEKNGLIQQCTEVIARQKQNRALLKGIHELVEKIEQLENQYRVLGDLANVAKGNNSQKISFERYVLAAFFNDIVAAANIRLRKMTSGRYEMNRSTEKGKGAAQSGLDLEVYDYYTGRTRHIKTLSGGESFKASLSLALGLADVVQAYAGGISLETMFVDEGFGTLDPESLDSAVACLIDLQHSGRLVGIISHVPELKDSIDARLEIEAGKDGSSAKILLV